MHLTEEMLLFEPQQLEGLGPLQLVEICVAAIGGAQDRGYIQSIFERRDRDALVGLAVVLNPRRMPVSSQLHSRGKMP